MDAYNLAVKYLNGIPSNVKLTDKEKELKLLVGQYSCGIEAKKDLERLMQYYFPSVSDKMDFEISEISTAYVDEETGRVAIDAYPVEEDGQGTVVAWIDLATWSVIWCNFYARDNHLDFIMEEIKEYVETNKNKEEDE